MPHDALGQLVSPGDIVHIPARVISVQASEDYCNVDVELLTPMPPYKELQRLGALNTQQVIRQAKSSPLQRATRQTA